MAILSAGFCGLYLILAVLRSVHPYELEWLEGEMVDHVARWLSGEPLYGPPALAFTSSFYPPVYFVVSGGLAWIWGLGYLPLRAVSIAASCGALLALGALARGRAGWTAGLLAAGLFAATYPLSGSWLDLARVDSLCLCLFLLGALVLRGARSSPRAALAATLVAAAVFTKQLALPMSLPLCVWALWRRRRLGAIFSVTLVGLVVLGGLLLTSASNGWFWYYVVELPMAQGRRSLLEAATILLERGVVPVLPALVVVGLAWGRALGGRSARAVVQASGTGGDEGFSIAVALALLMGSAPVSLRVSYLNALLPWFAGIALLVGLSWRSFRRAGGLRVTIAAILVLQLCLLFYSPARLLPDPRDAAKAERLVTFLASVEGEVFVPSHGWLAARAGKRPTLHVSTLNDVLRGPDPEAADGLRREIAVALRRKRFGAVVVDSDPGRGSQPLRRLFAHYRLAVRWDEKQVPHPVTGVATAPRFVYVPRSGPLRATP